MTVVGTEPISTEGPSQVNISPAMLLDGARSALRLGQRFLGAVLVLSALWLWVFPGANWATDVALFKLALSLAMGFSGLALWQLGSSANRLEIELDTETHEVRLMVMLMGQGIPVFNCRFNNLDHVDIVGDHLRLMDHDGKVLAEIDICQSEVKRRLMHTLDAAGLSPKAA